MESRQDWLVIRDRATLQSLAHSYRQWHTLRLAVAQFDVFTLLGAATKTCEQMMAELGASARGPRLLLDALAGMGLLEKSGEGYSNTPFAQRYLVRTSPDSVCGMWDHYTHHNANFMMGDVAIQRGFVPMEMRPKHLYADPAVAGARARSMYAMGRPLAEELVHHYDIGFATRMLDLGGAPGTYSIVFAQVIPTLVARVIDLPAPTEETRRLAHELGLDHRLQAVAGDIFAHPAVDFGAGYDLVLLSNVLHLESPEQNADLIRRAAECLAPGGRLLIHDWVVDDTRTSPPDLAVQAMVLLVCTEQGDCHTLEEYGSWVSQAGLRLAQTFTFPGRTNTWIIGVK